ncbi:hypothetical protein PFISCL1PPCAC_15002, partial [Pristionchus fissidentatus]
RVGECLVASITCPSPSTRTPRVRLLKTDNTYDDIDYSATLGGLKCTGHGWEFTSPTGQVIKYIKQVICFGNADGFQESPIDLDTKSAVYSHLYNSSQFKLNYGPGIIQSISMERTYSGFHVNIRQDADAYFSASHLDSRYRLVQYHGHWNIDDTMKGSEHEIDGKFYPAEFHFVHIREDFATLQEAIGQNGVAVIAVLAEISPNDNPDLQPMIDSINKFNLEDPTGTEGSVEENEEWFTQDPARLFPLDHNYLAYTGSLTTGLYQKCVAWSVLLKRIPISQNQLNVLGTLIAKNARDVIAIDMKTVVYTSERPNSRREKVEEKEEKNKEKETNEKEGERESSTEEPTQGTPSFVQNEKEEEDDVVDEIELNQEELAFLHNLRQKYKRRKSELRS